MVLLHKKYVDVPLYFDFEGSFLALETAVKKHNHNLVAFLSGWSSSVVMETVCGHVTKNFILKPRDKCSISFLMTLEKQQYLEN